MSLKIKIQWAIVLSPVVAFFFYILHTAVESAIETSDSERTVITMGCFIELNEGGAIPAYVNINDNFNKPDRSSLRIETKYGYASSRHGFTVPFEEDYYLDKPNLTTNNEKASYLPWLLTVDNVSLKNVLDTNIWMFTGDVMFEGYKQVPYHMSCATDGSTIKREHQSSTFSDIFGRNMSRFFRI